MSDTATVDHGEIIAAMRQMATEGKPVQMGDEVHTGDIDAAMIVGKIVEPGVVAIYDTRTGERSLTSLHMLDLQRKKTREDGSKVFSETPPKDTNGNVIEPVRGTLKCMLHPDDPNRALYDSWGLAVCTKDHLLSRQEVKSHVKSRHPRAWATIEEDRLERKEQMREEREIRNAEATMAALAAATGNNEGRAKKAG